MVQTSKMFDSPTTRVCSVRLNDVETFLALQVLRQMGVDAHVTSFSKLARACVALIALQAEKYGIGEPTVMHARETLNNAFGGVGLRRGQEGVRNDVYSEMRHHVDQARSSFAVPELVVNEPSKSAQSDQLWWQQIGCVSEDEAMRYTKFLRERGVTVRECSYTQWQLHISGVKQFNNTTSVSASTEQEIDPELMERAAEREREAQEQKRLMDLAVQQMQEQRDE